jgi:3-oxoacyl-[acyl-carrier-protein] synthase III
MWRSVITGTGCYIPDVIKKNVDFAVNEFYSEDHIRMEKPAAEIAEKFRKITGIEERRYAPAGVCASDMAAEASRLAILDSGIDPETIDQIILAHNFGDIPIHTLQTDGVPALASRVKYKLGISNPNCICYDLIFGCPGWLQGLIQADSFLKSGMARTCLVIGSETLSRVIDDYDRDGMIFSDGAGACVLEYQQVDQQDLGILSASVRSDSKEETGYIHFDKSNNPSVGQDRRYIKMKGRKVFEYALRYVPDAMKDCFDKCGYSIDQLKMIFIHQANEKMDESMCIHWLGNSSVATIPTLFDMVRRGKLPGHRLAKGELVLFASVGAGMNINAICYMC